MPPSRRSFLASAATVCASVTEGFRPPRARAADEALAPFDNLFTKFLADHELPGAAVAVTRGGKLAYARGFGLADAEKKLPVKPDALFRVASVSKPITGV